MKIKEEQIPALIKQGKEKEVIPFLYKEVFPNVKKYILWNKGNKDDALDVFQDAIVYFYTKVMEDGFDSQKYKVFGFLYRISINGWINKLRKDKRLEFKEEMMEYGSEEIPNETRNVTEENIIKTLFSGIGEKCVELLTYTVYYDLMMEDVMARMNFPSTSAVIMQQKRCKQKLIQEIEKNPSLMDKIKGI